MSLKVYIGKFECEEDTEYFTDKDYFAPSVMYPEYCFDDISYHNNMVYDTIRSAFIELEYDKENLGTKAWNPLGKFIKKGQKVLIKPNLVLHENHIKENGIECLITSPAAVRAVIDYCVLALKGEGKITIADAPVQSCDFEKLIDLSGYKKLISYYKNKGIDIELVDLRENEDNRNAGVETNVGEKSKFSGLTDDRLRSLRVTNYDPNEMNAHHNQNKNSYYIAKKVFEADVIINMPKPKTHRKAGVTISLKNMVGINANKAWLPHHSIENRKDAGDAYVGRNFFKRIANSLLDVKNTKKHSKLNQRVIDYLILTFNRIGRCVYNDTNFEGSWYGNDTLWRTIVDLNNAVRFAKEDGTMSDCQQRRIVNIADMIVCGESEGPLSPSPKRVGAIVVSENSVAMDVVVSLLMGVNYEKIPSIFYSTKESSLFPNKIEDISIKSNKQEWNNISVQEFISKERERFLLSSGWEKCKNIHI